MNDDVSDMAVCPQCGAPVEPHAPEGLCPRCLIALNLATETHLEEFGPDGTKVMQPTPISPPAPADIARYFPQLEILECLGRGGMGVVYKARQPKLDRFVALKILAPEKESEPKFAERFEREALALARLSHPNIVTVYDFGETDGLFFLLMEFVDGTSLRRLIQARTIEPEEALGIVPKICEALQYAHGKGIVHRDIKPENVLLDREGQLKIADFGIAKILRLEEGQPTITEEGAVGTPHYMAPEQVEQPKKVDHRADIYSLGVVFYEMLTGELPLGKFAPPSRKVHLDVRLDEVVLRALEKEPERRYQQASQVKTDVETIVSHPTANEPEESAEGPAAPSSHVAPDGPRGRRKLRAFLWTLLTGGAIGALLGLDLDLKYLWGIGSACLAFGTIRLTQISLDGRNPSRVASWRSFLFLVAASSFLVATMLSGFKATEFGESHSYILIATLNLAAAIGFGVASLRSRLEVRPGAADGSGLAPPVRATGNALGSPPSNGRVWPWVLGCVGGAILLGLLSVLLIGGMLLLTWFRAEPVVTGTLSRESTNTAGFHQTASGLSETERRQLQLQLDSAERHLAALTASFQAGVIDVDEVNAAQMEVEVFKAQLAGDEARVAQVRLDAAERTLELAQARFEAGLIQSSELEAARLDVELRKLDVRATQTKVE